MPRRSHIRILMCTHNGAEHLGEQLASFLAQEHVDWSLWVSDDGSRDATLQILEDFRAAHPDREIRILRGPGRGSAFNYLTLLAHPELDDSMVALSDQDDVWRPEKLARAAARLQGLGDDPVPTAYGAGWYVTDAALQVRNRSRMPRRGASFGNAMVQTILSGHSLVINAAARRLVAAAGVHNEVKSHDWWIYLLVTGVGGRVLVDEAPVLYYRQHRTNTVGANSGLHAAFRRAALLLGGDYRGWIEGNCRALAAGTVPLTPSNRHLLGQFMAADSAGGLRRLRLFRQLGLYRQTWQGTLLLLLAAALGRA